MWHKVQENPPYFLHTTQKSGFEVYVTDYVAIWFVYFTNKSFLVCLQDSNFGLEVHSNELIQKGTDLLVTPKNLKNITISKSGSTLIIAMTKMFEYPLKLKLKLVKGCEEMFFQNVSHMLLKTISDLKSSQEELRNLLKKKDDEIDEYKCEGKEIALRYLKTKRFNDEDHMKKHPVFKENEELLDVPNSILEEVAAAVSNNEALEREKMENHKIKEEFKPPTEIQSAPCLTTNNVKQELKVESQGNSVSPRKKRKPLLNY